MPLVTPNMAGVGGDDNDKNMQWMNTLMGKKIGDSSNESTFAKKDLPKEHRIVTPDSMHTMDYKPERLNLHCDKDGTVKKVTHG